MDCMCICVQESTASGVLPSFDLSQDSSEVESMETTTTSVSIIHLSRPKPLHDIACEMSDICSLPVAGGQQCVFQN